MPRHGWDDGSCSPGPLYSTYKRQGLDTQEYRTEQFAWHPRGVYDKFEEFDGPLNTFVVELPLFTASGAANDITTGNGDVSDGSTMINRAGYLVSAQLIAEDALATNDTNYLAFTLTNNGNSGGGSTAMLAATDANTTKATGGVAITAEIGRSLTVSGTAANLRVGAGDLLTFAATVTAGVALANQVNKPKARLVFATLPNSYVPRTTKTVGLLAAQPVANAAQGTTLLQLGSTGEANVVGMDWGDQLTVSANTRSATTGSGEGPVFTCRLKVSGVAANTRSVWGLASAYNATFDSVTHNAWFRLEGNSLALVVETDDDTTNNDDQSTGLTLTADTYYWFKIDARDPANVRFYVNDDLVKTLSAAAWVNTHMLQPCVWLQKDSGTGTESITVDKIRVRGNCA